MRLVLLILTLLMLARSASADSLLVLPANTTNNPVQSYATAELVSTFATADTYMRAFSYGATTLASTVRPWATYPGSLDFTDCANLDVLSGWAKANAIGQGYDPDAYDHLLILTPVFANCVPHGPTGPTPPLQGRFSLGGALHALTHELGLAHSRGEACYITPQGVTSCTIHKGGETLSITGSGLAGPPALDKIRLGWMDQPGLPRSVTGLVGAFTLEPVELPLTPTGIVALIVPSADNTSWLVIEAHTSPIRGAAVGAVLRRAAVLNGVPDPDGNILLDMDPVSSGSKTMLGAGEFFVDAFRRVIVAVESLSADGATVLITPCDGTCPAPPPPPPPPPPGGGR